MNIIDIALLVIVALVAMVSARKGFIMTLLNIVAYAAAGVAAKLFSLPVADYAYTNYFKAQIIGKLYEVMPSGSVEGEINAVVDNTVDALPGYMQLLMKQYGEAELSAAIEQSGVSNLTVEMIEQTYLAPAITDIFSMVATVLIFVLFGFLLRAVFSLVSRIFTRKKHKFIRGTNMILGAAMGAVKGTIIAGLIAAVLNIGAPAVNNPQLTDLVNTSAVCSTVAEILK